MRRATQPWSTPLGPPRGVLPCSDRCSICDLPTPGAEWLTSLRAPSAAAVGSQSILPGMPQPRGMEQDLTLRTARRPVGGQWSADVTVGGLPGSPRIASDDVGNIFLLWGRNERPWALRAARWSATLGAPTLGRVISSSAALSIDFAPLQVLDPSYAVLNYEYSLDDGATWTARAPASASSPMVVDGLIDGNAYPMRLRAVNVAGPGLPWAWHSSAVQYSRPPFSRRLREECVLTTTESDASCATEARLGRRRSSSGTT